MQASTPPAPLRFTPSLGVLALAATVAVSTPTLAAQAPPGPDGDAPSALDPRILAIVDAVSAERIERDIRTLAGFGTRHTLSDTLSETRGIGAARRWIKAEFDRISSECGGCLAVYFQGYVEEGDAQSRIPVDTRIVNVIAIQRGVTHPDRYVIMSGDIDSRVSDALDGTSDSPGANDNASGMAGALEAARVLSRYRFDKSIVFVGLSGEEQGLFGGGHMARVAADSGWVIEGVLNNDMIGNIEGVDGVVDNTTFRVFSEPVPPSTTEQQHRSHRFFGGEVDGPSRQLARYVDRITETYLGDRNVDAMLIYRLDRFGRGGHHRPFNDAGFPAVRIMETHENYTRQHQDLRVEDGIAYGDVIEGVNFDYAAKLTAVNASVLAALAWAPPPPEGVEIRGAVRPSAHLGWQPVDDPDLAGYKVYWRATTEPQWSNWRWVGDATEHTMEGMVIDNFLFGVAAVGSNGSESTVAFPVPGR
jgi:Zn-dependent M28 family amino/carboxypeptidase